jgi:hypothetical protein
MREQLRRGERMDADGMKALTARVMLALSAQAAVRLIRDSRCVLTPWGFFYLGCSGCAVCCSDDTLSTCIGPADHVDDGTACRQAARARAPAIRTTGAAAQQATTCPGRDSVGRRSCADACLVPSICSGRCRDGGCDIAASRSRTGIADPCTRGNGLAVHGQPCPIARGAITGSQRRPCRAVNADAPVAVCHAVGTGV